MKKASGIIEMALLICFVTVVAFVLMKMFNDTKSNISGLSNVTLRSTAK